MPTVILGNIHLFTQHLLTLHPMLGKGPRVEVAAQSKAKTINVPMNAPFF